MPPIIKRRANELLEEIRVGGSGGVDISGSRKMVGDLGRTNDTEPAEIFVQGDLHGGSGMVCVSVVYSRRTHRGYPALPDQRVVPSNTLFCVRQTSYNATSSLLLGAGFSSVSRVIEAILTPW